MEAFESLRDSFVLEQLSVPEDLSDPAGTVNLWLISTRSYDPDEEISVRGKVSIPTHIALQSDAEELSWLFREELLGPECFSHAFTVASVFASVVGRAVNERGVPSPEEAQKN